MLGSHRRWPRNPEDRWHFDIDIVGGCNLRCPSCPVGNLPGATAPTGVMPPDLLDRIIGKAKSECGTLGIALYNWTEPFIHPNLAQMIRVVRSHGVHCGLSTNLNILRNVRDVISADPTRIRVSVSGFSQENYGTTHKRGNIERVKKNMIALAEASRNSAVKLDVLFHRYLGNHDDERKMREFAEGLGYKFNAVWAYFMPLEKLMAYVGEDVGVTITNQDREVIDKLALPLDDALDIARKHRNSPCELQDKRVALSFQGDVMLCCTTYDQSKYKIGPYLDMSLEDIQKARYAHSMCGTCMKHGAHVIAVYGTEELDRIAVARVNERFPGTKFELTTKQSKRRKTLKKRVKKAIRRIFVRQRAA